MVAHMSRLHQVDGRQNMAHDVQNCECKPPAQRHVEIIVRGTRVAHSGARGTSHVIAARRFASKRANGASQVIDKLQQWFGSSQNKILCPRYMPLSYARSSTLYLPPCTSSTHSSRAPTRCHTSSRVFATLLSVPSTRRRHLSHMYRLK